MATSAESVLNEYGVSLDDLRNTDTRFQELGISEDLDAAIVTAGPGHYDLRRIIRDEKCKLLSIDRAEQIAERKYHGLHVFRVDEEAGTKTIATPALLVVRRDASNELVNSLLECLYDNANSTSQLALRDQLLSPAEAWARWKEYPFHDAARRFFVERVRESPVSVQMK